MGSSDYSGEDDKNDVMHIHPDRHGADPTEGWRRGTRGALRKSCDACTNSKTKCCGDIPCDRCRKRNLECKFSKRRRCGPKARPPEEKRPRTGINEDDYTAAMSAIEEHSPMGAVTSDGDGGNTITGISSSNIPLDGPLPLLPVTHRAMGFNAPMTADGLNGLVGELIGPALGDGGGSGSSSGSGSGSAGGGGVSGKDSTFRQATPAHSSAHYSQPNAGLTNNVMPFLSGRTSPPRQGNSINNGSCTGRSTNLSTTSAVDTSNSVSTLNQPTPSPAGTGIDRQLSLRSSRRLTSSQSAPISTSLPPRDLPTKSASMTSRQFADVVEPGRMEWEQVGSKSATAHPPPASRGPLTMSLGERAKAHLRTFMRSVGSIVLLPGSEALREAMNVEGGEGTSANATAMPVSVSVSGGSGRTFDPMQVSETDGGKGVEEENPGRGASGAEDQNVDALTEACQAEAWAAIAVGALFSGAAEEEANKYVSKALQSLGQCLDAPLPEVASVMILLTLFWMHSMDNRKVLRYFGFAQQVGLELGSLMPEGLQHTMAFMSVMVTMSLELDHDASPAVQVRDPSAWSVTLHSRPGGDPFVAALDAVTTVCSGILQDNASARRSQGAVNGMSRTTAQAYPISPSQELTNMLGASADVLNTSAVREGLQSPDHMLALLYGLKGYTQAARNEMDKAAASAKLLLDVIDRHPAVLHLPLTYTLAEASSRLVSVRGTFPTSYVESLQVARASLVFARPAQSRGDAAGSAARGGWCAIGDQILAIFDKGVAPDGGNGSGNVASKVQHNENSFRRATPAMRSASMSPPPERSARSTPRSDVSGTGSHWPPGEMEDSRPPRRDLSSSSPRWHESTDWVDRVRNMPVIAGPPTPGITRRSSTSHNGERSSLLGPGPMPADPPNPAGRYASEPPGLALLSGVAAPATYSGSRRASQDHVRDRDSSGRRSTGGRDPGVSLGLSSNGGGGSGGNGGGSEGCDRDSDELPPVNPAMAAGISFDPNRDDPNFPLL